MSDLKYVALLSLLIIDLGSIDVKQMEESTKLFLYNEYQINGTEIQNLKPVAVKINPERPIKIICHGLASNSSVYWYDHMIQAYLNLRYNVISVDWNEQANNGYINAINAIDDIGELIANCIANIHFENHLSMDDIHIIGHSIGAHIAGFFGLEKVVAVSEKDILFFLSNRIFSYEEFTRGDYSHLHLDVTKEVKIICHGWISSSSSAWYSEAKRQYEIKGGTNVIGVDWSLHSNGLYSSAVNRVEPVGYYIALLILDMSDQLGIPLNKFHVIGHSLGAHIGGYIGQYVQSLKGVKIGRITGLDPARPLYEGNPPSERLSDDDADFVDVIHTDAGTLGIDASIGHVDYFPNGGRRQNGCGIILTSNCSHGRAPSYFYESITSNSFIALSCSTEKEFSAGNCKNNQRIIMGEEVDKTARGDFYLSTAASAPFALGYV